MIDFETEALRKLGLRTESDKDRPIIACCVCQHSDKDYRESFQTAAMLRVR